MQLQLVLTRYYTPSATFGQFSTPDGITLYTVERPWLNNAPGISCIPERIYVCEPRRFFRGGYDAIEVTNVPGRTYILFHIANLPRDVLGCIGVGSRLGALGQDWAVLDSRNAFALFMSHYGAGFTLKIQQYKP